jgi:hypothetical protein
MNRSFYSDGYLSCYAGAGEPSGICDISVIHLNCDPIRLGTKVYLIGDIITEGGITKRTLAHIIAVAPYLAVLINTVKSYVDSITFPFLGKEESGAIPADSSGQITGSAGIFLGEGHVDGPVVRDCYLLPGIIIKTSKPCIRIIVIMKSPLV